MYPVGQPGVKWGDAERAAWLKTTSVKRSYEEEVLQRLEPLKAHFEVAQYGSLPHDPDRYPLFAAKSRDWDPTRPCVLVTGGVHGYETSGVQGSLCFLRDKALQYTSRFNIMVAPCVSPWGYECIQRWNAGAVDPNRSFHADSPALECAALRQLLAGAGVDKWLCHVDLHETTDTDRSEFRPAKAARDGVEYVDTGIPDGFYLVGDSENPQAAWHAAMIAAVRQVTHIAPPDDNGMIIGAKVSQDGCITYPIKELSLCSSVTGAPYATTTEVYPDSPSATAEQCNRAQVAAVCGALDYLMQHELR